LVGEFADELDNLGVRVAKLEKNADNVKITGNVRLSYKQNNGGKFDGAEDKSQSRLRTRLFFTGEVNDNWHYVAMLENNQYFQGQNESGDDDTDFQRAYLTGNIGVVNLSAGRQEGFWGDGNIYDDRVDSVKATVPFGVARFTAEYGKMANKSTYSWQKEVSKQYPNYTDDDSVADEFWATGLYGTWGNFDLGAEYVHADDVNGNVGIINGTDKIWDVSAKYNVGKFNLGAMYLKGDDDTLKDYGKYKDADDDGYVVSMGWAGAKASDPGSWGLYAKYYDQGAPTVIDHTMNGAWDKFDGEGFKGYNVGGNVTLAKNMVATVEYYDFKGKESDQHARTLWSQLVVTF
ncbi:hypothetical protein, partial [Acidaminococcus intestini]|uniref:hypothetical protein n=1 Tax=Acidaminococcus intestini TaxID=187327 RepID=UPI00307CF6EE